MTLSAGSMPRLGFILLLAVAGPTLGAGAEEVATHEGSGRRDPNPQ